VDEDEVGCLEVGLETPDEPDVIVRDDLGTWSDGRGVGPQGLLPAELESMASPRTPSSSSGWGSMASMRVFRAMEAPWMSPIAMVLLMVVPPVIGRT
jgi:hypothetical protein